MLQCDTRHERVLCLTFEVTFKNAVAGCRLQRATIAAAAGAGGLKRLQLAPASPASRSAADCCCAWSVLASDVVKQQEADVGFESSDEEPGRWPKRYERHPSANQTESTGIRYDLS